MLQYTVMEVNPEDTMLSDSSQYLKISAKRFCFYKVSTEESTS